MVCTLSYLVVALAASDFGGTGGIGDSSNGIGCSDLAVVFEVLVAAEA